MRSETWWDRNAGPVVVLATIAAILVIGVIAAADVRYKRQCAALSGVVLDGRCYAAAGLRQIPVR